MPYSPAAASAKHQRAAMRSFCERETNMVQKLLQQSEAPMKSIRRFLRLRSEGDEKKGLGCVGSAGKAQRRTERLHNKAESDSDEEKGGEDGTEEEADTEGDDNSSRRLGEPKQIYLSQASMRRLARDIHGSRGISKKAFQALQNAEQRMKDEIEHLSVLAAISAAEVDRLTVVLRQRCEEAQRAVLEASALARERAHVRHQLKTLTETRDARGGLIKKYAVFLETERINRRLRVRLERKRRQHKKLIQAARPTEQSLQKDVAQGQKLVAGPYASQHRAIDGLSREEFDVNDDALTGALGENNQLDRDSRQGEGNYRENSAETSVKVNGGSEAKCRQNGLSELQEETQIGKEVTPNVEFVQQLSYWPTTANVTSYSLVHLRRSVRRRTMREPFACTAAQCKCQESQRSNWSSTIIANALQRLRTEDRLNNKRNQRDGADADTLDAPKRLTTPHKGVIDTTFSGACSSVFSAASSSTRLSSHYGLVPPRTRAQFDPAHLEALPVSLGMCECVGESDIRLDYGKLGSYLCSRSSSVPVRAAVATLRRLTRGSLSACFRLLLDLKQQTFPMQTGGQVQVQKCIIETLEIENPPQTDPELSYPSSMASFPKSYSRSALSSSFSRSSSSSCSASTSCSASFPASSSSSATSLASANSSPSTSSSSSSIYPFPCLLSPPSSDLVLLFDLFQIPATPSLGYSNLVKYFSNILPAHRSGERYPCLHAASGCPVTQLRAFTSLLLPGALRQLDAVVARGWQLKTDGLATAEEAGAGPRLARLFALLLPSGWATRARKIVTQLMEAVREMDKVAAVGLRAALRLEAMSIVKGISPPPDAAAAVSTAAATASTWELSQRLRGVGQLAQVVAGMVEAIAIKGARSTHRRYVELQLLEKIADDYLSESTALTQQMSVTPSGLLPIDPVERACQNAPEPLAAPSITSLDLPRFRGSSVERRPVDDIGIGGLPCADRDSAISRADANRYYHKTDAVRRSVRRSFPVGSIDVLNSTFKRQAGELPLFVAIRGGLTALQKSFECFRVAACSTLETTTSIIFRLNREVDTISQVVRSVDFTHEQQETSLVEARSVLLPLQYLAKARSHRLAAFRDAFKVMEGPQPPWDQAHFCIRDAGCPSEGGETDASLLSGINRVSAGTSVAPLTASISSPRSASVSVHNQTQTHSCVSQTTESSHEIAQPCPSPSPPPSPSSCVSETSEESSVDSDSEASARRAADCAGRTEPSGSRVPFWKHSTVDLTCLLQCQDKLISYWRCQLLQQRVRPSTPKNDLYRGACEDDKHTSSTSKNPTLLYKPKKKTDAVESGAVGHHEKKGSQYPQTESIEPLQARNGDSTKEGTETDFDDMVNFLQILKLSPADLDDWANVLSGEFNVLGCISSARTGSGLEPQVKQSEDTAYSAFSASFSLLYPSVVESVPSAPYTSSAPTPWSSSSSSSSASSFPQMSGSTTPSSFFGGCAFSFPCAARLCSQVLLCDPSSSRFAPFDDRIGLACSNSAVYAKVSPPADSTTTDQNKGPPYEPKEDLDTQQDADLNGQDDDARLSKFYSETVLPTYPPPIAQEISNVSQNKLDSDVGSSFRIRSTKSVYFALEHRGSLLHNAVPPTSPSPTVSPAAAAANPRLLSDTLSVAAMHPQPGNQKRSIAVDVSSVTTRGLITGVVWEGDTKQPKLKQKNGQDIFRTRETIRLANATRRQTLHIRPNYTQSPYGYSCCAIRCDYQTRTAYT
eukprot:GHVT01073445.1.p1 GENE.GHVT01073445.1~~GHVT01073445.1.p1  ORF type:complete len:1726 (+),score=238.96 GHVT01073445.1:3319-8496(+)